MTELTILYGIACLSWVFGCCGFGVFLYERREYRMKRRVTGYCEHWWARTPTGRGLRTTAIAFDDDLPGLFIDARRAEVTADALGELIDAVPAERRRGAAWNTLLVTRTWLRGVDPEVPQ